MLRNYLKIAIRNIVSQRVYSLINVLGLAIGMACCLMIMLIVQDELSYDQFHEKKDRIYRVLTSWKNRDTGAWRHRATGQHRLRASLLTDFPQFEQIVRIIDGRPIISYQEKRFRQDNWYLADQGFFDVFSFELLKGDPETALLHPFQAVITPETAQKYFGSGDPIDKVLTINDKWEFKIVGIVAPAPRNAHFHFGIIGSMASGDQMFSRIVKENWGEGSVHTYVLTSPVFDPSTLDVVWPEFVRKHIGEDRVDDRRFLLEPVTDIHLYTPSGRNFEPGGDINYVYAFSSIAVFILLIACSNFTNLATARSARRAREVGLRKAVGARRSQLALQFFGETFLISVFSLGMAVGLVELLLSSVNATIGKEISMDLFDSTLMAGLLGVTVFVAFVAGLYPALFLSAFRPVEVLRGRFHRVGGAPAFRKILVTLQFGISVFLIVATAVIYQQLSFTRTLKLGYNTDHVVLIRGFDDALRDRMEDLKLKLLDHPGVQSVALTSRYPSGRLGSQLGFRAEGVAWEDRLGMQTVWVGYDFFETIDLPTVAGRTFDLRRQEAYRAFILNESAVAEVGWTPEEAIGKELETSHLKDWRNGQWERVSGTVVGVVEDVYFESLRAPIKPMVYFLAPYMAGNVLIRIHPEKVQGTVAFLEEEWTVSFVPGKPFEYTFLDDRFNRLYRKEELQGRIFGVFAGLAILVACLGLFGLASFEAEQRTKEIGVRKVLGASIGSLLVLQSGDFAKLVLIGNVVAWPVAYHYMGKWLTTFTYRIEVGLPVFILGGLTALVIAILSVSLQTGRAALANPVDSLRHE